MFTRREQDPNPLDVRSTEAFERADRTADLQRKEALLQEAQDLAGQGAIADAYRYLQKAVGLIAITLPFVVLVGNLIDGGEMKGSISSYYYTNMGGWFVGSLFALGVFFLSYNYRTLPEYRLDNVLSNLASLMAISVALFPTSRRGEFAREGSSVVATIHLVCAGVLFVLLAIFALVLFRRTGSSGEVTPQKRRRNQVYAVCGSVIVAAIVLVPVSNVVDPPESWHALYWLETVAVIAFGISWLVKGEFLGILADRQA